MSEYLVELDITHVPRQHGVILPRPGVTPITQKPKTLQERLAKIRERKRA